MKNSMEPPPDREDVKPDEPFVAVPGGLPATATPDEAERLNDLASLEILDTGPEREYEYLVQSASLIAGTPIALFTLIDTDRQWFKSRVGLEVHEGARSESFCGHAIQPPHEPFIVNDSSKDERFADNPWTKGDTPVVFYAGFPVVTERNHAVGTLCVIDSAPRTLTPAQIDALSALAKQAGSLLGLRRDALALSAELREVNAAAAKDELWVEEHDKLTSLATLTVIERRVDNLVGALGEQETPAAVIWIKLPEFGEVPALLGHLAGDAVLRAVAATIDSCLPAGALLARTAATSFAALLAGELSEDADAVAETILAALTTPLPESSAGGVTVLPALGTATVGKAQVTHAELLLAAEVAASEAATLAPGQIVEASEETAARHIELERGLRMRTALITAIAGGELTVAYMPIVDLETEEVVGSEALARWHHEEFGQVDPATFVRVAERSGTVGALDALVLEQALEDLSEGRIGAPSVSVNLSPAGLSANTPGEIEASLERWQITADQLTLEVTERSGLTDNPRLAPILESIAALGVKIALDDFGAGETSIAHLRELPITQLKLDLSLISDLDGPDHHRALAVATSIAILARSLGIEAVAEGIETLQQKHAILSAGVRRGQGLLFAAPARATSGDARSTSHPSASPATNPLGKVSTDFFESTPDLTCIADGDRFVRLNSRWSELLGWSDEHLLASSFMDFVHEDDRASTLEQLAALAQGEQVVAFENRYATADGEFKQLLWNAHTDAGSGLIVASAHDVTSVRQAEASREHTARVLGILSELQERYLSEGLTRDWWEHALAEILSLTKSGFGFIGRIESDEDDAPYLVTYAITNIAWNEWSRALFDEFQAKGLEFRNHETLFGVTLSTGEFVIANDPANDPRAGGLPEGHPPLGCYAGIPLFAAEGLVGMIGIADRDNGFSSDQFDEFTPLFLALGQIIALDRSNQTIQRSTFLSATSAAAGRAIRAAADRKGALTELVAATLKLNAAAQVEYYAVVGNDPQMQLISPDEEQSAPSKPRSLHPEACIALTTGEPHISRATGSARERCEHLSESQNDTICINVRTSGEDFGVIVTTIPPAPEDPTTETMYGATDPTAELLPTLVQLASGLAEFSLANDISRRALSDPLTGLANRTRFAQAISAALSRTDRRAEPFSVILIDLDKMKSINDRFGHPAGDAVLVAVGKAIAVTLREEDTLARFGGDEYAVLLHKCDLEQLQNAGRRIHSALNSIPIEGDGSVHASLGGIVVNDNESTWHEIYRAADSALYAAKQAGGNKAQLGDLR